ncbi:PTS transporter subunit EIIC [Escherichia coli]
MGADQNPVVAFGIYGFIERCLVPFGLHHIWNVPFQMQIGEYTNEQVRFSTATFRVIWRVTRLRVNCLVASCSKCTVCQLPQLLSGTLLNQKTARKWAVLTISAALTSFLTGITEPIEFSFMFVAPILYIIHAILAGLAFPICILLGMRDNGTSFSHGLIDFIVLSGNSSKLWLFPIVGIGYAIVYYTIFRVLIKALDLKMPGS